MTIISLNTNYMIKAAKFDFEEVFSTNCYKSPKNN